VIHVADVIHHALVTVAIVCSGLVIASFGLFARDQLAGASNTQASLIASPTVQSTPATSPKPEGQPRRFIDDAASKLTAPFRSIVQSNSAWVQRSVPMVFGMLVYGVGLGYLARYARGRS
jgi:hypothetical protein